MDYTQEQILKLSPDDASTKAGKQLANTAKWVSMHSHEKALWGDCQGSGKNPYKTIIDLTNLAFKCSCPSRKFPCKHGLGLFLLYAQNKDSFTSEENLASHVEEWLSKRETKAVEKEKKPVDEAAQKKRALAREKKVNDGIEELRTWIKDIIRTGILQIAQNPYQFNKNIIARMVDAQAGGLASQLRRMDKINFYVDGWQKELTKLLSKIYLITEAYFQKDRVDPGFQDELLNLIGWNTAKEEVLKSEVFKDKWFVLSMERAEEGDIFVERIWLYGFERKKFGLILNFYVRQQIPPQLYTEGSILEADLVYYPSSLPMRALVKEQYSTIQAFWDLEGFTEITTLFEVISSNLAVNPLVNKIPFLISDMKLVFQERQWFIKDKNNQAIPLANTSDHCWQILAISQAEPFSCFVIFEDESFSIYSIWVSNTFYNLS